MESLTWVVQQAMAQPQPVTDLSPEEMLDCLSFLLRNLRTSNLCETVMRSAKCLSELESDNDRMMQPYLRAVRCVPAFQELDNMAVAHLIKKRAAQGMVAGFTSIHYFFLMLPTPERHNGIKDYDELAGLYRMPAEVLAARSLLHHDPFQSSDPDVAKILETVTKSVKKMGTSNRLVASSGADEGVADLEAGLARLALDYTPSEAGDSRAPLAKHQFLTYLRWVVLGRKASGCPFAKQPTTDGATLRSSLAEKRSTLSDGIIPGSCAMCGSHDAAHQCKLCPISLNEHGSKHIISATTYCNEDCRNFHFEAHKSTCKERRKLARSSVLFMEAFQHYLEVANRDLPFSAITMEQGVVTKHYVPILKPPNSLRALADSKWQADAAMASFACADILYWARPLFDLLIQRKYGHPPIEDLMSIYLTDFISLLRDCRIRQPQRQERRYSGGQYFQFRVLAPSPVQHPPSSHGGPLDHALGIAVRLRPDCGPIRLERTPGTLGRVPQAPCTPHRRNHGTGVY